MITLTVMDSSTVQYERVALKKGSKIYWQKILISCKKIYKDINLNCQHFVFASKHVLSLHCHHCKVQGLLTSSSPVCICFFFSTRYFACMIVHTSSSLSLQVQSVLTCTSPSIIKPIEGRVTTHEYKSCNSLMLHRVTYTRFRLQYIPQPISKY